MSYILFDVKSLSIEDRVSSSFSILRMKTFLLPSGEAQASPYPTVFSLMLNMFMYFSFRPLSSCGSNTFFDVLDSMSQRNKQPSSPQHAARYSLSNAFTKVADQQTLLSDRMTSALSWVGYITDSDGFSKQLMPMASDSDIEKLFPRYTVFSMIFT